MIIMSVNNDGFVAWEEHIICHERGSRVVHYHLKDTFGGLVLAVIGTERSIRHMTYVVSDEFLEAYGSNDSINASTKWRARREVVDWLTSMVSNEGSPLHVSNAQINGSTQGSGSFGASMTGFNASKTYLPVRMGRSKLKVQNSHIKWFGAAWICAKELKHYPAFFRNGTTITEWVSASRVAAPDKLAMRCLGRKTIRPHPQNHSTDYIFEVGAPVDAWWSDGWWEGVVSGVDISGSECLQVYLPGEGKFLTVPMKNVRSSRDWVDNRWVDVMAKPDILRYLSADAISSIKLEAPGCDTAASLEHKVVKTSSLVAIEEDEPLPGSVVSGDLKNVKEVYSRQRPDVNEKDELNIHAGVDDDVGGGDCDGEEKAAAAAANDGSEDSAGNNTEFLLEEDLKSVNKISEAAEALEMVTQVP